MKGIFDTLIIGGGAAGMTAAIMLKKNNPNLNIAVFEKLPRVGKKVSVTGNGRCNISNTKIEKSNFYSDDLDKAFKIITDFDLAKTTEFFSSLGVELTLEENKIFPRSFQASSVVDALRFKMLSLGIHLFTEVKIGTVKKEKNIFTVSSECGDFYGKSLLICTGGMAGGSKLGSDGDGYKLFKTFGHKIYEQNPVICQIKTENTLTKALKGIKVTCKVTVTENEKVLAADFGEVLFCDYGLSGPPILQVSRYCKKGRTLHLDLFYDLDQNKLLKLLIPRIKIFENQPLTEFFAGLLHKKLGSILLKSLGISLSDTPEVLTEKDIKIIGKTLKDFSFTVTGNTGFVNAQATSGGAVLKEFNQNLMSLKTPGLFGAGEVLNADGDCGGYNLQWAWSSANAAAKGIIEYLERVKL